MAKMNSLEIAHRKELFLKSLNETLDIPKSIEAAGIAVSTYYLWKKEDSEFAANVEKIHDRVFDIVESKLFNLINTGDKWALQQYLKYKGSKRGYNEKIQVEANVNNTIKVVFGKKKNNDNGDI